MSRRIGVVLVFAFAFAFSSRAGAKDFCSLTYDDVRAGVLSQRRAAAAALARFDALSLEDQLERSAYFEAHSDDMLRAVKEAGHDALARTLDLNASVASEQISSFRFLSRDEIRRHRDEFVREFARDHGWVAKYGEAWNVPVLSPKVVFYVRESGGELADLRIGMILSHELLHSIDRSRMLEAYRRERPEFENAVASRSADALRARFDACSKEEIGQGVFASDFARLNTILSEAKSDFAMESFILLYLKARGPEVIEKVKHDPVRLLFSTFYWIADEDTGQQHPEHNRHPTNPFRVALILQSPELRALFGCPGGL